MDGFDESGGADGPRCITGIPGIMAGGFIGGVLGGLHALIIKPFTD